MEKQKEVEAYTVDVCNNIESFIDLTMEHLDGLTKLPSKLNHLIEYEIKSIEEKLMKLFARQYLAKQEYYKLYSTLDAKLNNFPNNLKFMKVCFVVDTKLKNKISLNNILFEDIINYSYDEYKELLIDNDDNITQIYHFIHLVKIFQNYVIKKQNLCKSNSTPTSRIQTSILDDATNETNFEKSIKNTTPSNGQKKLLQLYKYLKPRARFKFLPKSISFGTSVISTMQSPTSINPKFLKFAYARNSLNKLLKRDLPNKNINCLTTSHNTIKLNEPCKSGDEICENNILDPISPLPDSSFDVVKPPQKLIKSEGTFKQEDVYYRLNRFPPRHRYIPVVKVNYLCSYCNKPLWIGLKCKICRIKCHSKCAEYLPKFCSTDLILQYGHLLNDINRPHDEIPDTAFPISTSANYYNLTDGRDKNISWLRRQLFFNNTRNKGLNGIRKSLSSSCLLLQPPINNHSGLLNNTTTLPALIESIQETNKNVKAVCSSTARRCSKDDIDLEFAKTGDWSNYKPLLPLNEGYTRDDRYKGATTSSSLNANLQHDTSLKNNLIHLNRQTGRNISTLAISEISTTPSSPTFNTSTYSPTPITTSFCGGGKTPSLIFNYDSILKNSFKRPSSLQKDQNQNMIYRSQLPSDTNNLESYAENYSEVNNDFLNTSQLSQLSSSSFGDKRSISPPSKSSRGSPAKESDVKSPSPISTSFDDFRTQWTKSFPNSLKEWNIPFDQIEIGECIGSGWQAKVYKGYWHGKVAIKVLKIDDDLWSNSDNDTIASHIDTARKSKSGATHGLLDLKNEPNATDVEGDVESSAIINTQQERCSLLLIPKDKPEYEKNLRKYKHFLDAFRHEISILRKTRHQNLVLFMGASIKPPLFAIVTSFIKGASLNKHLHVYGNRFTLEKIIYIATQISQGMGYLHAKGILHKDLRSKNIFLESGRVIISDFGIFCAVKISDTEKRNYLSIPAGWIYYLAPELMRSLRAMPEHSNEEIHFPFTCATDVFSFGTILFELMTGEYPFSDFSAESIIWQIGSGLLPSLIYAQISQPHRQHQPIPSYHQHYHQAAYGQDNIPSAGTIHFTNKSTSNTTSAASTASVATTNNCATAHVLINSNFHFKTLKLLLYSYCWSFMPQSRVSFGQVSKALEGIKLPSPHLFVQGTQSYNISSSGSTGHRNSCKIGSGNNLLLSPDPPTFFDPSTTFLHSPHKQSDQGFKDRNTSNNNNNHNSNHFKSPSTNLENDNSLSPNKRFTSQLSFSPMKSLESMF